MNAIETKQLVKKFGTKTAVEALNLTIADGEFFALLGVNGAGKTTTIRMLSCLLQPTGGDALLYGKSILHEMQVVKELTNVSPQETAVAPNLTVRENLEFMAGIYGKKTADEKAAAAQMLEHMHMQEIANDRARTLSGGWQRRLSIAMALISEPKVLFLDEPTLGLDVLARRELWKLLESHKGKTTIILTTHYLEEAQALADRIGIMSRGRLKAVGTVAQLQAQTGTTNFEDAFIAIAEEAAQ